MRYLMGGPSTYQGNLRCKHMQMVSEQGLDLAKFQLVVGMLLETLQELDVHQVGSARKHSLNRKGRFEGDEIRQCILPFSVRVRGPGVCVALRLVVPYTGILTSLSTSCIAATAKGIASYQHQCQHQHLHQHCLWYRYQHQQHKGRARLECHRK